MVTIGISIGYTIAPGGVQIKVSGTNGPIYTNKFTLYNPMGGATADQTFICTTDGAITPPVNSSTLVFVSPVTGIGPTLTLQNYSQIAGRLLENDGEYMARQAISIGNSGAAKSENILQALLNRDPNAYMYMWNTAGYVGIYIDTGLADEEVGNIILANIGSGVTTTGTTTASVALKWTTPADFTARSFVIPVHWTKVTKDTVTFDCTVEMQYDITPLQQAADMTAVEAAMLAYINTIAPGGKIYGSKLSGFMAVIDGVLRVVSYQMKVNGSNQTGYILAADKRFELGAVTATWT